MAAPFFGCKIKYKYIMNVEQIAIAAHEQKRAVCTFLGLKPGRAWNQTNKAIKTASLLKAETILANPDDSLEDEHHVWCNQMKENGWKAGSLDVKGKIHPDLVKFDNLSDDQKKWWSLEAALIKNMAAQPVTPKKGVEKEAQPTEKNPFAVKGRKPEEKDFDTYSEYVRMRNSFDNWNREHGM